MPQNINNIMVAAGSLINFTGTTWTPPCRFRVEKKRKESKKAKKLAFKKPEGLRVEAVRLREAAAREEEAAKKKKEKADQLLKEADELEKKLEKQLEGKGKGGEEDAMDVDGGKEKTLAVRNCKGN